MISKGEYLKPFQYLAVINWWDNFNEELYKKILTIKNKPI